jgi:uncharacterized protein YbaA (DUF1428 family)
MSMDSCCRFRKKAGGLSPDGAKGRKDLAQTTIKVKSGETVMFSWIVFKSRAHRDRVNAKVMKDSRLAIKRMAYGGFRVLVDL